MPIHGTSPQHEPHVVTIRVRHRVASAAGAAMVLAMLPFLGGSVSTPRDSVVLAAAAPQAAPPAAAPAAAGSPDGVDSWRAPAGAGGGAAAGLVAAQTTAAVAGTIQQVAAGAGTFLFPTLDLVNHEAIVAMSMTAGQVGLSWPLHGPEASGFGPRIHPVLGRPMFHTGIDLMAACGTPIRAAADGQVEYAAITPSWGRRVIIRHTASLETGYAHMSQFLVKEGDVVKRGQVIGLVGTTGWSTGCHLHLDVIVNGHYVDPAPYLGLPGTSTAEVPFYASPHVETGSAGPGQPVEDGDVPVAAAVPAGTGTSTAVAPKPKPRVTTSTPSTTSTGTPTTGTSTTTSTPPPTTTTSEPPPTTTTSTPPPATTTSTPPPATTTSTPPPATTTSEPPPATTTSEPAPTTSSAAPESTTATPTAAATAAATSSATETVAATTEAVLEETAAAG